jgi:hypothetical protein
VINTNYWVLKQHGPNESTVNNLRPSGNEVQALAFVISFLQLCVVQQSNHPIVYLCQKVKNLSRFDVTTVSNLNGVKTLSQKLVKIMGTGQIKNLPAKKV